MKIFNESGKGYCLEGIGTLRAEGENRPSRPGHIVLDRIGGGAGSSDDSVTGCDLYNGTVTGKIACTLSANACASANHAGPSVIVLNDQGGSVMQVSDRPATLRAQDHGHPPVICFEPGIAKRLGGHSRYTPDVASTLRADMGDNQPAVCYAIDHVVTTGGNCTAQGPCWYQDICPTEKASGVHAICYERNDHVGCV